MYRYKFNIDEEEYDSFVGTHPQANLLQSSKWARVKNTWGHERLTVFKGSEQVASALILIQTLPLGFTMFYIPRGPIMDYDNVGLVEYVLTVLKAFAKEKKAIFIKFDPAILLNMERKGEQIYNSELGPKTIELLKVLGCRWGGATEEMGDTIQPRFQAKIYKESFSEQNLPKSVRQSIRTARNKGIEIIYGREELLDDFASLMKKTESRKGISLRNAEYYLKILQTYPTSSFITLSRLNLKDRLEVLLSERMHLEKRLANSTKKTQNVENEIERINKEIQFLQKEINAGKSIVALAGTLTIEYGCSSENIYAGMDENFRQYQPAILTWFETAMHTFGRGSAWQNLGGIENNKRGGLYKFKSSLQPAIEELIGEFDLPTSWLYPLFILAYKLRKRFKKYI